MWGGPKSCGTQVNIQVKLVIVDFRGKQCEKNCTRSRVLSRCQQFPYPIFNILYPSLVKKLRYAIIKQKLRRWKLSSYGHVTNRVKSWQWSRQLLVANLTTQQVTSYIYIIYIDIYCTLYTVSCNTIYTVYCNTIYLTVSNAKHCVLGLKYWTYCVKWTGKEDCARNTAFLQVLWLWGYAQLQVMLESCQKKAW